MDGTSDYQYLCSLCHGEFRSAHEATSCRLCSYSYIYEIESITFYLRDSDNHEKTGLVAWRWRSRNHHPERESSFIPQQPGVVIRLRRDRISWVSPLASMVGGTSHQLQSTVENITHCNEWYWCYQCNKPHTLDSNVVVSSSSLPEIIQCHQNPTHRTIRFTDALSYNSFNDCHWCYRCERPHFPIPAPYFSLCSCEGDESRTPIQFQKTVIIYRDANREIFERLVTLLSKPSAFEVIDAVGRRDLNHIVTYESDDETYKKEIIMGLIPRVRIHDLTRCGECRICLEEFEVGDEGSELPCKHIYHKECLAPWMIKNYSCPVCRCDLRLPTETSTAAVDDQPSQGSFRRILLAMQRLRRLVGEFLAIITY
ncbi:unnamed protein product [Cuscuta epithymum]|uniref:RING-type E3 ubiquitin transferase n=1 Tax=Cuscuta epithymum TaxID=186058 RepID=A0AAV0EF17_9ASTE|nr:unnamed protein product [Cuscuta epithymum]